MSIFKPILLLLVIALLPQCLHAQESSDDARLRKLSYFYMAAQRAKAQERYADMLEMLFHCQEIMPDDPATVFELGQLFFPLRMDSLGTQMTEHAVSADPNNPWYLERLATIYLSQNKQDKALVVLEKMATLQTKRVDVLSQLFMLYKQMGRTQDVIATLNRIQTLQGNNIRIAEQKYQLYHDMDSVEEALDQIREVCREFPYDVSCHLVMAEHYMENEMLDSALVCLDRAERLDPHSAELQVIRLHSLLVSGDTLRYEQKRDSLILSNKADLQVRLTALRDVAVTSFADSLKREPTRLLFEKLLADEDVNVAFLLLYQSYDSYLHQDVDDYFNLPLAERILKADPASFETLYELVQYYADHNDVANLKRVCSEALTYFPSEVRFHYLLALAYFQDKQDHEAEETLKAGIRQSNEETPAPLVGRLYTMLGDLYHEQNREAEAFIAYDSCLVYSPDDASCLNNYAYYLSLKGMQLDKAEKMSYRAVKLEPNNKTYLDTYAWVLFVQEDYTTARIYMDRVVDPQQSDSTLLADPEANPVLLEHAGDIYAQCGDLDTALRLWGLASEKAVKSGEKPNAVLRKKLSRKRYLKR